MAVAAGTSWLPVLMAGAGGVVLAFAMAVVRDAVGRSRQQDIDLARLRNHQTLEEGRWADDEQRWALTVANEKRLLERLTALETAERIHHARFEEQPWGPRPRE